ncbi:MAG: MobC family plasmid mobilization relaxosome protein [Dysgonamonadaceae bacterium]|jgi:hypothetical protein|nr:MobC family plasmid mobilization relaxosome protein [Dysgonamonadaceae bacterium]
MFYYPNPQYFERKLGLADGKEQRSEYIRRCIAKSEVKQRLTSRHLAYIRQLAGMANNINQIARKANAAGYIEVHPEWVRSIKSLDNLIKRIEG